METKATMFSTKYPPNLKIAHAIICMVNWLFNELRIHLGKHEISHTNIIDSYNGWVKE